MKKLINIFALCALTFAMTACGGSSDPVKMAEEFATAYLNADYDKCNKLMEDEEFTPSNEMSPMEKAFVKSIKEEAKKMQYVVTLSETDADESNCPYVYLNVTSASDPDFDESFSVFLEKDEDTGKWTVDNYDAF